MDNVNLQIKTLQNKRAEGETKRDHKDLRK